jgi:hypothetical protein
MPIILHGSTESRIGYVQLYGKANSCYNGSYLLMWGLVIVISPDLTL